MADYRYIKDKRTGATHRILGVVDNTMSQEGIAADSGAVGVELMKKANKDGSYDSMTVGNAEQLISTVFEEDSVPYQFRTSGGSIDIGDREEDKIIGGTVAWNQLANSIGSGTTTHNVIITKNSDGSYTLTGTPDANNVFYNIDYQASKPNYLVSGHVYYFPKGAEGTSAIGIGLFGDTKDHYSYKSATDVVNGIIFKTGTVTETTSWMRIQVSSLTNVNIGTVKVYPQLYDLTTMFGSTIAEYIYALETATYGSGIAWLKSRGFFTKPYYAYNPGELLSVSGLQSHDMVGFNAYNPETGKAKVVGGNVYQITGTYTALSLNGTTITPDSSGYFTPDTNGELVVTGGNSTDTCVHLKWDGERDGEYEPYVKYSYPLDDSLTLRGIPKLDSNNQLYYDGDVYESDGTVTRKYGIVDLGTLDWTYDSTNELLYTTLTGLKRGYPSNSKAPVICSAYATGKVGKSNIANKEIGTGSGGGVNNTTIIVNDSAYTDAETFETAMSGVYLVYELATPTTESAEPYQNPQILDDFGTEEYVTTSIVPVGHKTKYQPNLRAKLEMAPNSPSGNGDYVLRQTNGQNEYVPLVMTVDKLDLPDPPGIDGVYPLVVTVTNGQVSYGWGNALS